MTKLELEFVEKVSVIACGSSSGLVVSASVECGYEGVRDISIELTSDPVFFTCPPIRFESFDAGSVNQITDKIVIRPDPDFMASLEESVPATVTMAMKDLTGAVLAETSCTTEILPFNYWPGLDMVESVAAFVTPNADILASVRTDASDVLGSLGLSPSLSGYQGDVNSVIATGAAVFTALHRRNITYVNPPAGFEVRGQRIRLPAEVLEKCEGTCIDLAVLYCAVMESIGINTVIFVSKGHAFAGFWLMDNHAPDIVTPDSSKFSRSVRNGEMRAVECTLFTNAHNVTFEAASEAALSRLDDFESFVCAVDIAAARTSIRPMPTRTLVDGRWVVDRSQLEDGCVPQFTPEQIYEDPALRNLTRVDRWKRELLDIGTRNSLINMRVGTKTVPLMLSEIASFEDLFSTGKEFFIHPKPQDWTGEEAYLARPFEAEFYIGNYAAASSADIKRGWIRTPLTEGDTEKSLRSIYRGANRELEESGCNAAFLALGVLRWYEGKGTVPHFAPLILLPVEMKKKNTGYSVRPLDEEPVFNVTLAEMLRQEYEIQIPGTDPLPTDDNGVNVDQILQIVRRAVSGMEGWEVLNGAALGIFTFSQYAMWKDLDRNIGRLRESEVVKCMVDGTVMTGVQDIDASSDPYGLCLTVPADGSQIKAVSAAASGVSFVMHGPPGTGKSQTITNIITDSLFRGKTVLFVAEKRAALEVVQKRLNKVGVGNHCLELHSNKTEKTKVVEQLKASLESCKAVDSGKLDELMAEIEKERASLDGYVEELHASRPWGLSAYDAISRYESYSGEDLPDVRIPDRYVATLSPSAIGELEDRTSRAERVYASVSDIKSPEMSHVKMDNSVLGIDDDVRMALEETRAAADRTERAMAVMNSVGLPVDFNDLHKACGFVSCVLSVPPDSANDTNITATISLLESLRALSDNVRSMASTFRESEFALPRADLRDIAGRAEAVIRDLAAHGVRLPAAESLSRELRSSATELSDVSDSALRILDKWKGSVFRADAALRVSDGYSQAASAGFFAKKKARYAFISQVSEHLRNPNADFDSLEDTAKQVSRISPSMVNAYDCFYRADTAAMELESSVPELARILADIANKFAEVGLPVSDLPRIRAKIDSSRGQIEELRGASESFEASLSKTVAMLAYDNPVATIAEFRAMYDGLVPYVGRFFDWAGWNVVLGWFAARDLTSVTDLLASGVPNGVAPAAASKGMYRTMFNLCRQQSETLRLFSSDSFESSVEHFRKLDEKYSTYNRNLLKYRLYQNTPRDLDSSVSGTEAAILYKAINSSRMRKSIRQLLSEIPNILPRICPCLLMSPQSVAQYITHDFPKFDIVIFDESSQIVTAKAIGALGRAKCTVVAGDNKQLPPTSFFQKQLEADEEDSIDVESFLDDCLSIRMPETYLEWHYRSRHESLIGFSNAMFYGSRMLTFPSPNDSVTKVSMVRVKGTYERGRRTNPVEARAVAEEVRRRVKDPELRRMSIGIVAFSISQQTAIEDELDEMEKNDKEFSAALAQMPEPMFVKNLETVQGDERDVILFSIGYGPGKDGTVFQNFGPINRAGGGRRLNVAVSRSRMEMVIFTSMTHNDVKVTPASSSGVRTLKEFLRYAANGGRFGGESGDNEPRTGASSIMTELAEMLSARGYASRFDVGTSEFRVDLAVIDPDDPNAYILGILSDGESYRASENTRDREYARSDVLRNLGWAIMHVWSVDWYFRRERVIESVVAAIERARTAEPEPEEEPEEESPVDESFGVSDLPPEENPEYVSCREDYVPCRDAVINNLTDPIGRGAVRAVGQYIIGAESPIAEEQLIKTYCRLTGIKRLVADKRRRLVDQMRIEFAPRLRGSFVTYWHGGVVPEGFRMYRVPVVPEEARDIDCIPVEEILSCIDEAVKRYGSMEKDSAPKVIAAMFGFSRVGDRIREIVGEAMEQALLDGIVVLENGRYSAP